MGITCIPKLFDAETASKLAVTLRKIDEICEEGKYYRHPDSVLITYPLVVDDSAKIGSLPNGKDDVKIAIIGAGAAGISSCYELSRLGNSNRIQVTMFESDTENCIFLSESSESDTKGKRAGRVYTARGFGDKGDSTKKDYSVYELGAMRFPEVAGLTWHYARAAFGGDKEVEVFPNPGKIPTEFVCGSRSDRFSGAGGWLDPNSPTNRISQVVRSGIYGDPDSPSKTSCYFPIGGKCPYEIGKELDSKDTPVERLQQINEEWKEFAIKYDDLTLEAAVKQIIRGESKKKGCLPVIEGLGDGEDHINYCLELFGCFGFGTGGYKSIFNISLTEMMRLLLWDYANEYTLPTEQNAEFLRKLFLKAKDVNKLRVNVKCARVSDVCHSATTGKALVFSYNRSGSSASENVVEEDAPKMEEFDYVILAVTPKQMSSMICRAGYSNVPHNVQFGDFERQYPELICARPPLILSKDYDARNSEIVLAINQVHMTSSTKVYVTIKEADLNKYAPDFKNEGKIKSVISDCGLGSSYIVPSPLSKTPLQLTEEMGGEKYYNLLLSYTWEEDTKRLQHHLYNYPMNNKSDSDSNKLMINTIINRTVRNVKDPETGEYKSWWFGDLLSKSELSNPLSQDWTTDYSAGGFKLDTTGCHYNSNLCFRYNTHAADPTLKNRFFIAGCSYSHIGGWLEGAFMTAVNAVTGLVLAANCGDLQALGPEARKVITSLDSATSA
uniref:Tryptophan 2-monooxygenase oxidoreductase n=1 Tax=Planococcus citri TaxID=170843 RepID=S5NTH6_9HEMI|nr:tryptophan 2-monooxygenase oxidoreductase [Planococcus citri]